MNEHEYKQHRCIEENALLIGLIEQIGVTLDLFQEITNGADYLVYLWEQHPDRPKLTVDRTHFWTYSDAHKPRMVGKHIFTEHELNEWLRGTPVGAALRIHKLRLLADLEP